MNHRRNFLARIGAAFASLVGFRSAVNSNPREGVILSSRDDIRWYKMLRTFNPNVVVGMGEQMKGKNF